MPKSDVQTQLDLIEDNVVAVHGYLSMLLISPDAVVPPIDAEVDARRDQLDEVLHAVVTIKKAFGLPSKLIRSEGEQT